MLTSHPHKLWRYRELLVNLVRRDLRVKYRGSTLGFAWSLLHPLVMATVYTVAFRYVLRVRVEHFPVFLLSGLLPWSFFVTALTAGSSSIVDNGHLVKKVAFPRAILPAGVVFSQFVQFVLMFLVIAPVAAVASVGPTLRLVSLVPLMALLLLFATGCVLATAAVDVYFRDVRHLVTIAVQVWFWLTPVAYPVTFIPETVRPLVWLNPMAGLVVGFQDAVLGQANLTWGGWSLLTASTAVVAACGLALFSRLEPRFGELV